MLISAPIKKPHLLTLAIYFTFFLNFGLNAQFVLEEEQSSATITNQTQGPQQVTPLTKKPFAFIVVKSDLDGLIEFDGEYFNIATNQTLHFPLFKNSKYRFVKPQHKKGEKSYITNYLSFDDLKEIVIFEEGDTINSPFCDILILEQYNNFLREEELKDFNNVVMNLLKTDFIKLPPEAQDYQKYANLKIGKYEVTVAEYSLYQRMLAMQEGGKNNVDKQVNHSQIVDVSLKQHFRRTKKTGIDWQYNAIGEKISENESWYHPVVNVSWEEAAAFCVWLSEQDLNNNYRLPTRTEWIYFAQGGTYENRYPWGNKLSEYVHTANFRDTSIYLKLRVKEKIESYNDGHPFTSEVGSFSANSLGVYDMGGNVAEWLADELPNKYKPVKYKATPIYDSIWKQFIGGSYFSLAELANLKSTKLNGLPLNSRNSGIGFRVVQEPKPTYNTKNAMEKGTKKH